MTMQTPEFMQEMMDQTRQTFEAGITATTRMWDAAGKAMGTATCVPSKIEDIRGCNERITRNFAPVMRDNLEMMTQAFNTQFKTNMDFLKRSFEKTQGGKDFDWTRATQDTMKDAFSTMRSQIDFVGETGAKAARNWSNLFVECACDRTDAGKMPPKPAK